MYARDLMLWLHERLAERGTFEQTQKRFESLRGHNLLPRGRENAGVRLTDEQIANAILGYSHPLAGHAGHASLILGDLRPVGGEKASFKGVKNVNAAIAILVGSEKTYSDLLRLTLSIEQDFHNEKYAARIYFKDNEQTKITSFVSKYAYSLLRPGSEDGYNHERLDKLTAVERSFGSEFFRDLSRGVSLARHLDRPLKTDWREYEAEEEKRDFHRRLGARSSSHFMNLRVDAQVTWPKEPTRMTFGGHHLVLFPKTKDHSHSVSIDLANERISAVDARTLINRLLSVMSWCDDKPASLHEGWSGNPVPVPVPKQDLAFMTMQVWLFYRSLPQNEELLRCLAYYRDGLNADSVGLASHAVLSFYKVFETRYDKKKKAVNWINTVFSEVKPPISESTLQSFESGRQLEDTDIGTDLLPRLSAFIS